MTPPLKPLCIYHGNCADGFGATWAVRQYFGDGNVEFHAASTAKHHRTPPAATW